MADRQRVLVTRPAAQSATFCEALEQAGIEAVSLPLLVIEPTAEARAHPAWQSVAAYDWILFTSANGVAHAWSHASDEFQQHPNIATVGPATAQSVVDRGGHVRTIAPVHIAESLAESLGNVAGMRILWPRGAEARDVLTTTLRARGATVDEVVVYQTRPTALPNDAAQRVRDSDVATFASPSAVRRFVECFGAEAARRVVCIGPVTAAAARARGLRVDAVAESYTTDGLLSALATIHG